MTAAVTVAMGLVTALVLGTTVFVFRVLHRAYQRDWNRAPGSVIGTMALLLTTSAIMLAAVGLAFARL